MESGGSMFLNIQRAIDEEAKLAELPPGSIHLLSRPEGRPFIRMMMSAMKQELVAENGQESSEIPYQLELLWWQKFYRDHFNINLDITKIKVPEKPAGDFWLVVMAQGVSLMMIVAKCRELFPFWVWTDKDLDQITEHDRDANKTGSYAVWFRACIEADKEFKNLSANQIKTMGIKGITLPERLVLEIKHFLKTGQRLDMKYITLCTGSRYDGGGVPGVYSSVVGGVCVDEFSSGYSDGLLRVRQQL